MELKPQLSPKLIHKLRLTPQLKQAIHILQLNVMELRELAEQEFEQNPLLEIEEPFANEDLDMEEILDQDELSYYMPKKSDPNIKDKQDKQEYLKSLATTSETLQENLIHQLHLNISNQKKMKIGEQIVGNINEDGYLEKSLKEIAKENNYKEEKINEVLKIIQDFYPPGVGARNLKECLLIQLKLKGYSKEDVAYKIVESHLEDLEKGNYKKISKKLNLDEENIKNILKEIAYLEPKCGREFKTEKAGYVYPDLVLKENENGYEVEHKNDFLPTLNISSYYKKLIKDKNTSLKTRRYLKKKLTSALWLIDAINQRQNTILKVTQCIVDYQKEFIEEGEGHLKPLILKEVAEDIGMSESTVSRATTGKYLQTPHGVMELKEFFSRKVKNTSADKIKALIKSFIKKEDSKNPLSDSQIKKLLKHEGIDIARRTVAKYRDSMKILPSHLRRGK